VSLTSFPSLTSKATAFLVTLVKRMIIESAAEQSESASPDDDEGEQMHTLSVLSHTNSLKGAANMNRPSLTIVGWMVAFLAVGAGFMA